MTVSRIGGPNPAPHHYVGLSSDTKPTTNVPPGSTFFESDTGLDFIWGGTIWGKRLLARPAPLINALSTNFGLAVTNPNTFPTAGLVVAPSSLLLGCTGIPAGTTLTNITGSTDDTSAVLVNVTHTGANLDFRTVNVLGAGLDPNLLFNKATERTCFAGLIVLGGFSDLDPHASNRVTDTGDPAVDGKPVCDNFTTANENALILAATTIRGSHLTNPPLAPDGYTLLFSQTADVDDPDDTQANTLAVAYRHQPLAGAVPAATFNGCEDVLTSTQLWSTVHMAFIP